MDGLELCEPAVRRRRSGRLAGAAPQFQEPQVQHPLAPGSPLRQPPGPTRQPGPQPPPHHQPGHPHPGLQHSPAAQHPPQPPPQQPQTGPADLIDPAAGNGLPGSAGEHLLQGAFGTEDRARRFYADQMLDHLNPQMIEFIDRMEMLFIATADGHGDCDSSLRAGPPGFVQVLGSKQIAYPEYRGNGVLASLGNISENPHIGILMIDFVQDLIGLHVNGKARIVEDSDLRVEFPGVTADQIKGRNPERWVVVEVEEAYVHCRKHIPRMVPVSRQRAWGTDDLRRKGGDYFGAKEQQALSPSDPQQPPVRLEPASMPM